MAKCLNAKTAQPREVPESIGSIGHHRENGKRLPAETAAQTQPHSYPDPDFSRLQPSCHRQLLLMMDDRLPVHASPYAGRTPYTSTQSDTEYHSPIPVPHGPNTPYSGDTTNSPAPAYTSTPNASSPYTSHHQYSPSDQTSLPPKIEPHEPETLPKPKRKLSKKWQRRLYW